MFKFLEAIGLRKATERETAFGEYRRLMKKAVTDGDLPAGERAKLDQAAASLGFDMERMEMDAKNLRRAAELLTAMKSRDEKRLAWESALRAYGDATRAVTAAEEAARLAWAKKESAMHAFGNISEAADDLARLKVAFPALLSEINV